MIFKESFFTHVWIMAPSRVESERVSATVWFLRVERVVGGIGGVAAAFRTRLTLVQPREGVAIGRLLVNIDIFFGDGLNFKL